MREYRVLRAVGVLFAAGLMMGAFADDAQAQCYRGGRSSGVSISIGYGGGYGSGYGFSYRRRPAYPAYHYGPGHYSRPRHHHHHYVPRYYHSRRGYWHY